MDANATLQEDVTLFRQFMRVMHLLRHQNTIQPPVLPTPSTSDHSNDAAVQDGATESEENDSWDSDDDSIDSDEHSDMDQDMMSGQQHRAQDLEDQDSYDFEQEDEDESDYTMDTDISGDYLEESQQTPAPGFHSPGPDPDPPAAFDSITVQPPPQPPSSPDTVQPADSTADLCCWDHGCNGRRFTTASNLRRHARERLRTRPVCQCPRCGATFSRTTARNTHLARGSCNRIRRYSNGRPRPGPRVHD